MTGKKDRRPLSLSNPELASEWDSDKNGTLTPDDVPAGSSRKVYWKCPQGHSYFSVVVARNKGVGCPYCSGNKVLPGFNDLATTHPAVAAQWDYEKNAPLTPNQVIGGTHYWRCEDGHSWRAITSSRKAGNGCPICAGKKVERGYNDLESLRPDLAAEWDADLNGSLSPSDFTKGSSKKVCWLCPVGHSYKAAISARYSGTRCPYCTGRRVLKGFNDLQTLHPELAQEWDVERNRRYPYEVTQGAKGKFSWFCNEGHNYEATISDRRDGTGCPFCSGRVPIAGVNDLETTHPEVAREWDFLSNEALLPQHVKAGSAKRVFWKCALGHSYLQAVAAHVGGLGCPFCSNQRVLTGFNDLATTRPDLATEWDLDRNGLGPESAVAGSNRLFYWRCPKGHSYRTSPSHRTLQGAGCSVCAGKKVLIGYNDLASLHPALAKEWNREKNRIGPEEITAGSSKKFHWKCEKGHSWVSTVSHRVNNRGCPECAVFGFKPQRQSVVYFLIHEELRARKIGITNLGSAQERIQSFAKNGWEPFQRWEMVGDLARRVEAEILNWIRKDLGLPQFLTREEMGRLAGETETFSIDGPSNEDIVTKVESVLRRLSEQMGQ